jgi:NAD(P)-dependent dehydrogenase (short-subunit alcohol dehydrogenase family)
MKDLSGKVAVITGGGSERGIGRATGALLAEHGAKVVLADVNREALSSTVRALSAKGYDVTGVPADVTDISSMRGLADAAVAAYGSIDIVFLNAGIGVRADLLDQDTSAWETVTRINFLGVLYGIKAFVPRMIAQGTPGHVLATTSPAGIAGTNYTSAAYAASKAAMCSLMESLHGRLRADGADIATTIVAPPLARTNLAGDPAIMDHIDRQLQSVGVPPGLVEPEQVAELVLDAIVNQRFWASVTPDTVLRVLGGKLSDLAGWQAKMARERAESFATGGEPDAYIWG